MSEIDEKLNTILSNPQMMKQIMNLAQSLGTSTDTQNNQSQSSTSNPTGFSPSMLNRISSIMEHGTIDNNQQSLLKALSPYLSKPKIQKLERAMHAAKMAGLATEVLNTKRSNFSPGR